MIDLTNAWWRHLVAHQPPGVHAVTLFINPGADFPAINVQLVLDSREATAEALLGWMDTMAPTTLTVWRTAESTRVHITVAGSLPTGEKTRVWGGMPYDPNGVGGDLEPGQSTPLGIDELRRMADST